MTLNTREMIRAMEGRGTEDSAGVVFDAVATELLTEPDVEDGTGFGTNPGLRTGGRIFAILHDGELVVKLPAERCSELTAAGGARAFQIGTRTMREWVCVAEVDRVQWLALAREAREYVSG